MRDGEFWIDPEASGNAFKVYCDMTTDKGKKNKSSKKKLSGNEKSICHCVGDEDYRTF